MAVKNRGQILKMRGYMALAASIVMVSLVQSAAVLAEETPLPSTVQPSASPGIAVPTGTGPAAVSTTADPGAASTMNPASVLPGASLNSGPAAAAQEVVPSNSAASNPTATNTAVGPPGRAAAPLDGSVAQAVVENRPVTDKWAFIVGIGKFEQPSLPALRYAAKDAQDFRDFLVEKASFKPDHVRLLLNEKATRKQILSGFDKFLGRVARKDDLVVVYFSTHGSPDSCDARGKSYLVSYDTDKDDLFASSIPMSDITDLVRERINSNRVLLVMDTCFSGAVAGAGSKSVDEVGNLDATKIAQGSGQLVICSSSPKEKSWESRRYSNGIFTRKLMDALCLNGSKTKLGDAFNSIRDEVENEVREDHGIRQRPVFATASWKGDDLLLAAPPAAPRPVPDAVREMLDPDSSVTSRPALSLDRGIPGGHQPAVTPSVTTSQLKPPAATGHPALVRGNAPAVESKKPAKKSPSKPAVKSQPADSAQKAPPPVAPLWSSPDR